MGGAPLFDKIVIIGLGLIGSSIARSARAHLLAHSIIGCDRNQMALAYGRAHGVIDVAMHDPRTAVSGIPLIILAAPPSAFVEIARQIAPALSPGAIVMDVASVKQPVIDALRPHLPPEVHLVPTHPVAGSEQSGVSAGRADLFQRRRVIITPEMALPTSALRIATKFWTGMGARVEAMPAPLHDTMYAYVSHLPHLLAFAAHHVLADRQNNDPLLRKFLRLSRSNPVLWTEIFMLNKENIIKGLDRYLEVISHIKSELALAPEKSGNGSDETAYTTLFPRIAASCLVSTAIEAEKLAGISFARYAGPGFADFTAPAAAPPEKDMEKISEQHAAVSTAIGAFCDQLHVLRDIIAAGNAEALHQALAD